MDLKKITQIGAVIVVAGASYFVGTINDISGAIGIITNEESAVEHCKKLIEGNFELEKETE